VSLPGGCQKYRQLTANGGRTGCSLYTVESHLCFRGVHLSQQSLPAWLAAGFSPKLVMITEAEAR